MYVMDADGSGVRKVFGSRKDRWNPSWSPDGRKIAYVQGEERDSTIYTATIKGGLVEKLTEGFMPSWSPDGREIVFSAINVNSSPLGVFNLRTRTKKVLLSNKIPWAVFPAWSPRGNKIAFSQIDGRFNQGFLGWTKANIYVVNRDGAGLHQIIKDETAVAMRPTWSPDSDELIYTDVIMRLGLPSMQLFKTDLSDHSPMQLTHEGDNYDADWFDPTALDVSPSEQLLTTVWGKIKTN
jgi:TolB protein